MYKWVVPHVDVIDHLQWISAVQDAGRSGAVVCVISYMSTCSRNGGHYKLYIFYKCVHNLLQLLLPYLVLEPFACFCEKRFLIS